MPKDALRGTALAAIATLGAWLLARFAFGGLFYMGVLLPVFMTSMLLVAWLIHLKADGFVRGSSESPPAVERLEPTRPFASFDEGIRTRADGANAAPVLDSRDVMRALLWSTVELAIVSITLYHGAGIGAAPFR